MPTLLPLELMDAHVGSRRLSSNNVQKVLCHDVAILHCDWFVRFQIYSKDGQVKNAEVRKLKYGSENKSRLSVFSVLLTHTMCVEAL